MPNKPTNKKAQRYAGLRANKGTEFLGGHIGVKKKGAQSYQIISLIWSTLGIASFVTFRYHV